MKSINNVFRLTPKILAILFGLMTSVGSIAFALFLQFYYQLAPCPLCIFSRIILIVIGFIFFCWLLQTYFIKKQIDLLYFCLVSLGVICGFILSGYHAWLIHLPPEKLPSCGPDLSYLLETLSLHEAVIEAFKGSGSCAQDTWHVLGLNLAQLELGIYLMLTGTLMYMWRYLWRKAKKNQIIK